jgi:hypothetical protein
MTASGTTPRFLEYTIRAALSQSIFVIGLINVAEDRVEGDMEKNFDKSKLP